MFLGLSVNTLQKSLKTCKTTQLSRQTSKLIRSGRK